MDGWCDYHPAQRAVILFACASPDGSDFRIRMLCAGCTPRRWEDGEFNEGEMKEQDQQLLDNTAPVSPMRAADYFTYRAFKMVPLSCATCGRLAGVPTATCPACPDWTW